MMKRNIKIATNKKQKIETEKIAYIAFLIALSFLTALINLPGTSIALDSMPAYFAALFLGPGAGGLIAALGHIITAAYRGFYLTLPLHMIIGIQMAFCSYLFGWIYRRFNGSLAIIVAIIFNGPIALLSTVLFSFLFGIENGGWILFTTMVLPLTLAATVNVLLAYGVFKALKTGKSG